MSDPSAAPLGQNWPSGTVTFLFTDIEGSTQLWEKYPEEMRSALARHDSILRGEITSHNGHLIKTTGDGVHAVFTKAVDAINAALEMQRIFTNSRLFEIPEAVLRVRMGLHTGEAELRGGDYYGQSLNRAARLMSIGHGGQILISEITLQIAQEHLLNDVSVLDLGLHHLKGVSKAEKVYQILAPDLQREFPVLRSLTHATNNLPTQLTSFIGRENELAEVKSKLENARLLTLIGPGGTGKTRLSIQLGSQLLSAFKDGLWLVELASISDPSLVMQTIASTLDIREQPGMPLKVLVHDYLRAKHLLLILDNCEHLVEASAQVADEFLHVAPNIKIVASSREALGINGETVYRVPSLSLPGQDSVTREAALGCESVQLFVERASAANPTFQLTDENASAVGQICSRLDGIPLAIELSASRITVFSPDQIARRLDDRFKLLTGGSRTALPRQKTLRALIDWSYDLLSEPERALLRSLSVFAGGWTFEAAETICNNLDVFEHLPQLVNKSLVVVKNEGDEPRYYLLETIRQYGRDKLLEFGEGSQFRNRHLEYFVAFADTAGQHFLGFDSFSRAKKLRDEHDNIRAALEWAFTEDIDSALHIVGALPYFWITQGYAVEGRRWALDVLEQSKLHTDWDKDLSARQIYLRANAYLALCIIATDLGDNELVLTTARESINLARKTGDQRILAFALAYLASGKANLGKVDEAYTLAQEALVIARETGDPFAHGYSLTTMGEVTAMAKHDYETAQAFAEESISLSEKAGYRWGNSMTVFGLGYLERTLGEYDKARRRYEACLPVFNEIGDRHRINMVHSELAHIEREQGQYQQAIPMYRETIREWQRLGHRAAIAHQLECLAFIAKAQEKVERALRLIGAAEALRQKINIAMTPPEREIYDREVADLKANMDQNDFAILWAEGRRMTMEQAIQFAVE